MERKGEGVGRAVVATLAGAFVLGGCASTVNEEALKATDEVKVGPQAAPFRTITNFSHALRCMDNHMITFGVRDVSVLVEELTDQTKKVSAGTRDMLISAVSEMTKRSRSIKLVAYGQDSNNVIGFLQQAERKSAYSLIPQFDIKGSISQFDESVAKKDASFGVSLGEIFSYGRANTGAATILGVDLTVLDTEDLSVVPGVTSRNGVVIFKQGKDVDSDAQYRKFGINFSTALAKSEGNGQALRNLIELSVIELFGKLTNLPYWGCLGADPNTEAVKTEVSDWYYTMSGDVEQMIGYFQYQFSLRGIYSGPVDGKSNPQLAEAIEKFRGAVGLPVNAKIDLDLFSSYLNADHARLQASYAAIKTAAKAADPEPREPIALAIASDKHAGKFRRGEVIGLSVKPSRDAYVYCYMRDEKNKVQRFFPNRFSRDAMVSAKEPLKLPGDMRFQITASEKGKGETIMCLATPNETLNALPETLKAPDFEPVDNASLDQIKAAFGNLAGNGMGSAQFKIEVQ